MESNCDCVYVSNDDPSPEFHNSRIVTAKKEHTCSECDRIIYPIEKYEYVTGVWEGDFLVFKTCSDCLAIRNEFFCDSWVYGMVLEHFRESLLNTEGEVSEDCLASLPTKAREMVITMMEQTWK